MCITILVATCVDYRSRTPAHVLNGLSFRELTRLSGNGCWRITGDKGERAQRQAWDEAGRPHTPGGNAPPQPAARCHPRRPQDAACNEVCGEGTETRLWPISAPFPRFPV